MGQETGQVVGYRLSPPQQRLWSLARRHGAAPFTARCLLRITGRLDAELLRRAFEQTVTRHEVLRTRYEGGGRLRVAVQVVEAEGGVEFVYEAGSSRVRACAEYERAGEAGAGAGLRVWCGRVGVDEHEAVVSVGGLSSDAAGLGGLVREAVRRYAGAAAGGESVETEEAAEPAQYADLSEWLNEMLESDEMGAGRDFWRRQDTPGLYELKLPFSRADAEEGFDPRTAEQAVAPQVAERLRRLAEASGVSLPSVFLTAWAVLLWRLAGQTPFTAGLACDGRTDEDLRDALGLLMRYVPLRVSFDESQSFEEALKALDGAAAEASEWQEFFTWQQVELPEASGDGEPFFPVCSTFADLSETFKAGAVSFRILRADDCSDRFELNLCCQRLADGLRLKLSYDAVRFSPEDAERLLLGLDALLADASARPRAAVGELNILSERERHQLLHEYNDTSAEYPRDKCLHTLFEEQAARTPESVAVVFGETRLSYAELNERAERLARRLRGEGVRPDTLVGVFMERSLELPVALLGVLKAGGAYMPLDPDYPAQRVSYMIEDASAQVLLTQGALAGRLPEVGARVIRLDEEWDETEAAKVAAHASGVTPDNLAYVIYTSGSTGQPKGAMLPHRGVVNCIHWMQRTYDLRETDAFLLKTSLNFDPSVWELFWTLAVGARVVVAEPERHQDAAYLVGTIKEQRVTSIYFVPAMLKTFLEESGAEECVSLRRVICGGESLPAETMRRFYELLDAELHHSYGPTEASIAASEWKCDPAYTRATVPIGRPLWNTTLYVLDARMSPVPAGLPGELYIGGDGLARGYLGRPALTAERFVPDPFSSEAGARLYRTGDLAHHLPGGELEFLGRADQQVKVRGYRIELGEIEAALLKHAAVRECVVMAREDEPGEKRLIAYFVSGHVDAPPAAELRQHLRERLPDYMVPAAFISLDNLPLTPSGKIDRRALPVVLAPTSPDGGGFVEPRGRVQRLIAEVWGQVLGRARVGATENFFELGGDSILGIQVVARLARRGLRLTPRQLFRHQTVAELAEVAGLTEGAVAGEDDGEGEGEGAGEGEAPLTPIQRRFFAEFPAGESHWNQALLLRARAGLNLAALATALAAVERRHDALRLRFEREAGGAWRQRVVKWEGAAPLTSIELQGLPAHARRAALACAVAAAQAGLDIERGPLWRAVHFLLGEERAGEADGERVLLVIHHLGVDGVSWRVLLDDLRAGYEQAQAGAPVTLGAKTTSLKRWAEELERAAASAELAAEADYWRGVVEAGSASTLAGGGRLVREAEAWTVGLTTGETTGLLRRAGRAGSGAINELLLAALAEALCEPGGSVLAEVEGHGREEVAEGLDLTRTVGWFTSLYPVAVRRGGGVDETLEMVRGAVRGVPGGGLGYGVLRHVSGGGAGAGLRGLGQAPVSFNYLGQLDQVLDGGGPWEAAGESAGAARSGASRRWHEVEVTAAVTGGRLWAEWTCGRAAAAEVRGAAARFVAALRALATEETFVEPRQSEEEASYELTPMQQGMLFHSLSSDANPFAYIIQISYTLRGEVEAPALRRAWEEVVRRHPALRTRFDWRSEADPRQVVVRNVHLPWREEDWRGTPESERAARLEAFLHAERRAGFDFGRAPLMRLSLLRPDEESYQFTWTHHHSIMDGWSAVLVLREVSQLYAAYVGGGEPRLAPPPRPYADYVGWLRARDLTAAERFWRAELAGVRPTLLGRAAAARHETGEGRAEHYNEARARLDAEGAEALRGWARRERVTLNTAVQGAWGLVLSRESGEGEVLFGSVVSGRPAELVGVEAMVGLFINTLPVRVRAWGGGGEAEVVGEWLRGLQGRQAEARQYEAAPLWEVQAWGGAAGGGLFDSILVFENYPVEPLSGGEGGGLTIPQVLSYERNNYPLALLVMPDDGLTLQAIYDTRCFDEERIERMLRRLIFLLEAMPAHEDWQLLDLSLSIDSHERPSSPAFGPLNAHEKDEFAF